MHNFEPNTDGLLQKPSSSPCIEDNQDSRPLKKRRVQFSDLSSFRTIEQHDNETAEELAPSRSDEEAQSSIDEGEALIATDAQNVDTKVPTKGQDGPSPATIATQRLFRVLIQAKKINRQQVKELLQGESVFGQQLIDQQTNLNESSQHSVSGEQVLERLRSLSDRIETRGTASLLPCTTRLGRQFLPAIRFLMTCMPLCAADACDGGMTRG